MVDTLDLQKRVKEYKTRILTETDVRIKASLEEVVAGMERVIEKYKHLWKLDKCLIICYAFYIRLNIERRKENARVYYFS